MKEVPVELVKVGNYYINLRTVSSIEEFETSLKVYFAGDGDESVGLTIEGEAALAFKQWLEKHSEMVHPSA